MIELKNVSFSYTSPTGSFSAAKDVSVLIPDGKITAITGKTGSGKSTLAEILGGITKPDSGIIKYDGKIGLVFQTHTFFEDTVYNEIVYAPKQFGFKDDEQYLTVKRIIQQLGLSDEILSLSPFKLSGGQQKLVSIAAVIAANPDILILDEPTAGLDAAHKQCVFRLMQELKNSEKTVVFITHSMENAAETADNIILINDGTVVAQGTPDEVLSDHERLCNCGLDVPQTAKLSIELKKLGIDIGYPLTVHEAYNAIINIKNGGNNHAS